MMMLFISVSVIFMIITSHSYDEWKDKIDNMKE